MQGRTVVLAKAEQLTRRIAGGEGEDFPGHPQVQAAVGEYLELINEHFYDCE